MARDTSTGQAFAVNDIIRRIDKFQLTFVGAAKELVGANSREIQTQAKRRFAPGSTKGKNRVGDVIDDEGRLHPHRRTGQLSRSIKRSAVTVTDKAVEASVFTGNETEEYAMSVELGSVHARPHPFLKPAGEASAKEFVLGAKRISDRFK